MKRRDYIKWIGALALCAGVLNAATQRPLSYILFMFNDDRAVHTNRYERIHFYTSEFSDLKTGPEYKVDRLRMEQELERRCKDFKVLGKIYKQPYL